MKRNKLATIVSMTIMMALLVNQMTTSVYPIVAVETKTNDTKQDTPVIEVPVDAIDMTDTTTVNGIKKEWFQENCIGNNSSQPAFFKITIPSIATSIGYKAFSTGKANYDSNPRYTYIHPSNYKIVAIDFSEATSLESIEKDAFNKNSELKGVIEFPNSLKTIKGGAFRNCSQLEGVYLNEGLLELGNRDGGSVFNNCTALNFVRIKDSTTANIIEFPSSLESIGRDLFNGALNKELSTSLVIPEKVSFIGVEAFKTSTIKTIIVKANDASQYHGKAFAIEGSYGVGNRMTIFNSAEAYKTFNQEGSTNYKDSLTFEFTMNFGDTGMSQQKLNNQPVQCVKDETNNWVIDKEYVLPVAPSSDQEGYMGRWVYNGKPLTLQTLLNVEDSQVDIQARQIPVEPIVQYEVDGEMRENGGSTLKTNVSNDKEHQIGVRVTHPLEDKSDEEGYVEFAYKWTDIWSKGSYFYEQGPRMSEEGFGNLLTGKSTIPIYGVTHERSEDGGYSDIDYGNGYYLVEVYGYFIKDGKSELFYKSANTLLGSDNQRTTNTSYTFNVLTSGPVVEPEVEITPIEDVYGYEDVELEAEIKPVVGEIHTYQWYRATRRGQVTEGTLIEGATLPTYKVEKDLNADTFHFYLEVTSTKIQNNDTTTTVVPVTFTVHKAKSDIKIEDVENKVYDGKHFPLPKLISKTGSENEETYTWYIKNNEEWKELDGAPIQTGEYKIRAHVTSDTNYLEAMDEKEFKIEKAENSWTQEPEIKGWIYGDKKSIPTASSQFGEINVMYSQEKEGVYTKNIPECAGVWYMKSIVEETLDYSGLETVTSFEIEKAIPEFDLPKGLTLIEGEKLGNIKLPKGFTWVDTEEVASSVGDTYFKAYFTPEDVENYKVILDISIPVSVKAKPINDKPVQDEEDSSNKNENETSSPNKDKEDEKETTTPGTGDTTHGELWITLLGVMSALWIYISVCQKKIKDE